MQHQKLTVSHVQRDLFFKMWYIHIIEYYLALKGSPAISNIIDELGGHSGKWNKPDIEGQTLQDTIYMRHLK